MQSSRAISSRPTKRSASVSFVDDSVHARDQSTHDISHVLARTAEWPAFRHHAALWLILAGITALLVLTPGVSVAIYEPRLSIAVGSVCGVIGLALLQLGVARFKVLRRPLDLYTGLGFGVLAIKNLFAAWAPLRADDAERSLERAASFLLLLHAVAAALFLYGLARSRQHSQATTIWPRCLGRGCALMLVLSMAGVVLSQTGALPPLLDEVARETLVSTKSIDDFLPGQRMPLVIANVLIAAVFMLSAIGYAAEARRLRDPHIAALGGALILIFFAQAWAVPFPSLPAEYVAVGDAFRLVGYGLLLSNVLWRTAQDVASMATRNERLRLSRELHDGLAQQLGVLRLRLGRVADATGPTDQRWRDLDVAQRMLESASVEARRTIATLRTGRVTWQDFEQALAAFSAEFSVTHEVEARVQVESCDLTLDSLLQADVLRILQEAFGNAVRHGGAKRITALVTIEGTELRLRVRDNGRGFDPAKARRGVGLHSMTERAERRGGYLVVDSVPDQGASIEAWVPLYSSRPLAV